MCRSVSECANCLAAKSALILVILPRQFCLLKTACGGGGESESGRGVWRARPPPPPPPQARLCNYALFCLPALPRALRQACKRAGRQAGRRRPGMRRSICKPRKERLAALVWRRRRRRRSGEANYNFAWRRAAI